MKRFSATKIFKVILIVGICVLLLMASPIRMLEPLRAAILTVFSPFQKVGYVISMQTSATKEFLLSVGQLKKENEKLREQNLQILAENARLRDAESENASLREQLGLLPREKYDLVAAYVVSQDLQGLGNWVEISKGRADGLENGMAVVVSRGVLIGKLQDVTQHTARVLLLTNPKSSVNAMTTKTSAKGILNGEYGLGIILDMILQTDTVEIGDDVVTSGIGGTIPRGLYIGTVQEVHPSNDQLYQQAVIASPIHVSKLQTVYVVKAVK